MKILILQGPNLNLVGHMSKGNNQVITLDKINSAIRQHNHVFHSKLKFNQTHKTFEAINFLQRNRNWADGVLFAPQAWSRYEYSLKETISILEIPIIQLLFSPDFGEIYNPHESIFSSICAETFVDSPIAVFLKGYDFLHRKQ